MHDKCGSIATEPVQIFWKTPPRISSQAECLFLSKVLHTLIDSSLRETSQISPVGNGLSLTHFNGDQYWYPKIFKLLVFIF